MNESEKDKIARQEFINSDFKAFQELHLPGGEDSFTEDELREALKGMDLDEKGLEQAKDFFRVMPYLLLKAASIQEEIDERGITVEQYQIERIAKNREINALKKKGKKKGNN
jgi:hypothetical protein